MNYCVRYFSSASDNPAVCGLLFVLCKQCLLKHARVFFTDLFTYADQVNNKCCLKLQLAKCLLLSALPCIDCIGCVRGRCFAAAMQVFSPVVFALLCTRERTIRERTVRSDTSTPCVGVPATCNIRPDRWLRECSLYAIGGTCRPLATNQLPRSVSFKTG